MSADPDVVRERVRAAVDALADAERCARLAIAEAGRTALVEAALIHAEAAVAFLQEILEGEPK